jgi:hypothetical protein
MPPPPGAPRPVQRSGLAIASMVLGICGIALCFAAIPSILALVFGFIALSRIKKSHRAISGRGMALAGVWLGGIGIVTGVAFWVASATGALDDDSTLGPADAKVGQCVNLDEHDTVVYLDEAKCADGHDGEVFLTGTLGGERDEAYPGDDVVSRRVFDQCSPAFGDYVGAEYGESDYDIYIVYLGKADWRANHREYVCTAVDPTGDELVGSVKGANH